MRSPTIAGIVALDHRGDCLQGAAAIIGEWEL